LQQTINVGDGYTPTIAAVVIMFATISGVHYNFHNLVTGFFGAEDKLYAALCIIPYAQFFFMLWVSSKSQFFE
jgi:hypothetical protein